MGQNKNPVKVLQGTQFTVEESIPATPVKDQQRSNTCWSFASTSFIESELFRAGKGEFNLSEMFFVQKAYELKADKYARLHGKINFDKGGLAMDVMHIWNEFGLIPELNCDGLTLGDSLPVHGELDAVLLETNTISLRIHGVLKIISIKGTIMFRRHTCGPRPYFLWSTKMRFLQQQLQNWEYSLIPATSF